MKDLLNKIVPVVALSGLLVIATMLGGLGPVILKRAVTNWLIMTVVVVGLYIFIGNSGVLSFGHTSFMMIGAYASAWLTLAPTTKAVFIPGLPAFIAGIQLPVFWGALVSIVMTTLIAAVLAIPIVRLSGIAASIATFCLLASTYVVYSNWEKWTHGTSALVGLPVRVGIWSSLLCAIGAIIAASAFQHSRWGLGLRASRENELSAVGSGINVKMVRYIAFVASASIVALGGVLEGHFLGTITVNQFYINLTYLTLAMLVVGGRKSLTGAVIGAFVVSAIAEILRYFERGFVVGSVSVAAPPGLRELGLAIVMLLILALRPQGLTMGREVGLPERIEKRLLRKK